MEPLGAIFFFFFVGMVIAGGLLYRHKQAELAHIERMTAMEKGVALPVFETPRTHLDPVRRSLLSGCIWLFSGAGLTIFVFLLSITVPQSKSPSFAERQAKIEALRNLGASDQELRRVLTDRSEEPARVPLGLAAVGLIPMGVGLAYLIFYAAEIKRQSSH